MAEQKVKAILFDLGETLFHFGPFRSGEIFRRAGELSYAYLQHLEQPVPGFSSFLWRNLLGLRLHVFFSALTGRDFNALALLRNYGEKRGFRLSDAQWEECHFCWYRPLMDLANAEPDLPQTLTALQEMGIRMGVVSNTFVHSSALERHMEKLGILSFFHPRLYSYTFVRRKPDRGIFLEAARQIGVAPVHCMYVGDRIDKDVIGSMRAGMRPVMIRAYTNEKKDPPDGTVIIEKIAELPAIVTELNSQ